MIGQWCVPASVTAGAHDDTGAVPRRQHRGRRRAFITRGSTRRARGRDPRHVLRSTSGFRPECTRRICCADIARRSAAGDDHRALGHLHDLHRRSTGRPGPHVHQRHQSPAQHQLNLALINPQPGAYTVTPVAGSPAIEPVLESHLLPAANIRVRVVRSGSRRVLHYSLRAEPGQKVEFLERAADADTPIGKPTAGSHGSIVFTPQPNATHVRRQIVAQLYEERAPGAGAHRR